MSGRGLKHISDCLCETIEEGIACRLVRNRELFALEEGLMTTLNISEARANLYKLVDETLASHEPVTITGKRGNAVLLSEDDWNAIHETLYLLSVPGMRESIVDGMNEPLQETSTKLDW